jgi:hypothetical protein
MVYFSENVLVYSLFYYEIGIIHIIADEEASQL